MQLQTLTVELINLQSIDVIHGKFDEILLLIRSLPNLKSIDVYKFVDNYESKLKIDEANEERSKLTNPRKVTVYVDEPVYLTVKWAKNKTNWSLIEIKRNSKFCIYNLFQYDM